VTVAAVTSAIRSFESARARPDVQTAADNVTDWTRRRTLAVHVPSPASEMKTNDAAISSRTVR
jgi:hypothetical protein